MNKKLIALTVVITAPAHTTNPADISPRAHIPHHFFSADSRNTMKKNLRTMLEQERALLESFSSKKEKKYQAILLENLHDWTKESEDNAKKIARSILHDSAWLRSHRPEAKNQNYATINEINDTFGCGITLFQFQTMQHLIIQLKTIHQSMKVTKHTDRAIMATFKQTIDQYREWFIAYNILLEYLPTKTEHSLPSPNGPKRYSIELDDPWSKNRKPTNKKSQPTELS